MGGLGSLLEMLSGIGDVEVGYNPRPGRGLGLRNFFAGLVCELPRVLAQARFVVTRKDTGWGLKLCTTTCQIFRSTVNFLFGYIE